MKKEWTSPELTCLHVEKTEGGGPFKKQDAFESVDTDDTILNLNATS